MMPMTKPEPGSLLETALALLERGFHVIPLGDPFSPIPNTLLRECDGDLDAARYAYCKKCRVSWKEFQNRQPTEEEITSWWTQWPFANPGIVTGINIVVIDGDTPEACAFLDSGAITRTPWKVNTARGGHFYYRPNPALVLKNSAANGIDVRGVGGYVVAAGATSGNGVVYEWNVDMAWGAEDASDLPMLTTDDVSKFFAWRGNSQPMNEVGEATGNVLANLGAVKLAHDGAAAQEGSRNNALTSMVGQWFRAGLSYESVILKARAFSMSCVPPLPESEALKTVASVGATHRRNTGADVPAFDEIEQPQSGFRVSTFGDWMSNPPKVPEMFLGDRFLFRQARLLVAGKPKHGKSQFVIDLGMAAASGGDFLGMQFEKPIKFLWMQAEIHEAFVFERIAIRGSDASASERALIGKNFLASSRCDLDLTNDRDFARVRAMLDEHKPDVLCFDPIINFSSAEENDNTQVRALLRRIDALGSEFDCAVVLLHHIKKEISKAADFDSIRGASAFRGWYDSGVILGGEKDNLVVSYELRNGHSPLAHGVQYDARSGRFTNTGYLIAECDQPEAENTASRKRPSRTGGGSANLRPDDLNLTKLDKCVDYMILALKNDPEGMPSKMLETMAERNLGVSRATSQRTSKIIREMDECESWSVPKANGAFSETRMKWVA